jgi:UDP-N-acetylmuramoyl-tripeptide--D-alanyl-D-alanine ligase
MEGAVMILRAEEIAEGTGGRLVRTGPPGTIGTDSRRLGPGQWFCALSGERFDGHSFLPQAQFAGCAGAIARHVPEGWTGGFVQVEDPLIALQRLARDVRRSFHGPVVGLTGTAGKTTTRAMIALALEGLGPVHQTEGNLNNHIGVPLTLLAAPLAARAWVIEMGMNHLGEIDLLQSIAEPTVRLITNVGAAHLEGVGSLEGVAQAKGELFAGARPGDLLCVNLDDLRVAALPRPPGVRICTFGRSEGADLRLTEAAVDPTTLATRFRVETRAGEVLLGQLPSPGVHLALNATAALAVGLGLGLPLAPMGAGLARYQPVGMRQRVEAGPDGLRVINDAYNANPLSCAASLQALACIGGGRRVALLGDMLELGAHEDAAHAEVLELALSLPLDLIGLAGPRYARAVAPYSLPHLVSAADAAALGVALSGRLQRGDIVLLKGSRGMAMERCLAFLAGKDR